MQIHKAIRWKDTAEWLENLHLLSTPTKYLCHSKLLWKLM